MKVLFFVPYALSTSHHEVGVELIASRKEAGDDVHIVYCQGEMYTCDQNAEHQWLRCFHCRTIAKKAWTELGIPPENIHSLLLENAFSQTEIAEFKNIEELKKYEYEGLNVGASVAASIVTGHCRDTNPNMEPYQAFVKQAIQTYLGLYKAFLKYIDELKPDLTYVFNGRTAMYHPVLAASQHRGVRCFVGERVSASDYMIFDNTHCLDLNYIVQDIHKAKSRMQTDNAALQIAEGWFKKCAQGQGDLHKNYIELQRSGKLPEQFDSTKRNIAIMCSSEDEYVIDPIWKSPLFKDQTEAIHFLIEHLPKEIHLYIRAHPNLKGLDCTQVRELSRISSERATVIAPEAPVDSYALVEHCETVIVFGSTIGIEAAYRNKAVVLLGRANYEQTGACHIPKSREEVIALLSGRVKPLGREHALEYGYWAETRGKKFQHLIPQDPKKGNPTLFKGKQLMRSPYLIQKILNAIHRFKTLLDLH